MARIKDIKLPNNQTYDIFGKNVQNISWEDYENLPSSKQSDEIAYFINNIPSDADSGIIGTASGAVCSFTDGSPLPMPKLEVAVEPQQDLHGYDAPWVGGAGKNKLQVTATTQTINGVTFTVNSDGTVSLSGTATGTFVFPLISGTLSFTSDTIITGGYAEASASKVALRINGSRLIPSEGYTISANTNITEVAIRVNSGFNTNGVKLYPMIRLATVTDATFAPYSNECPIIGWSAVDVAKSGANVWDEEWEVGGLNPLNGETTSENDRIRSKNFRPCKPNMTMFYYIPSGKGNLQIVFYDINKNYLGYYNFTTEHTFTTPNGCYFFKFNTGGSYGTTYNNDISINYPSTDTSYHAYNGSTITIQLGDTYYGCKLDVVSGVLTVDRAIADLGNLPSSQYTWQYVSSGDRFTNASLVSVIKKPISDSTLANIKSSHLKSMALTDLKSSSDDCMIAIGDSGNISVRYKASGTDTTAFNTAMNGVQLVYELATPQTIQLTPTQVNSLLGRNNIWANTGKINKAVYIRDNSTQLRMNDKIISNSNTIGHAIVADIAMNTPKFVYNDGILEVNI